MGRWEPDARGRLERAALELFVERGYEQATVTEIARRAGLAQRTFFRHFADKREVLFAGARTQQEYLVSAVARAPEAATPIDAVDAALEAAAAELQERGEYAPTLGDVSPSGRRTSVASHRPPRRGTLLKSRPLWPRSSSIS